MARLRTLQIERNGPVVTLCLSRPQVRNAFNSDVVTELHEAVSSLLPEDRVVVLTGQGSSFCAGADLGWMKAGITQDEAQTRREAQAMAAMFTAMDQTPRVVIGRINGAAFGGGIGLVACCDVGIAAKSAQFAFSETRLGLAPAVISPFIVRKIGTSWTRRYFLTGEVFTAAQALAMGLVHEVVALEKLDDEVARVVGSALQCGPEAILATKRLIRDAGTLAFDQALHDAAQTIARLRCSAEGQEGVSAFLEKREPNWKRRA